MLGAGASPGSPAGQPRWGGRPPSQPESFRSCSIDRVLKAIQSGAIYLRSARGQEGGLALADGRWLSSKTSHESFVNFTGNAHVVEVVFANLPELSCLVEFKYLAAFRRRCFARLDTQRPGNVIKAHKPLCSQPPRMHRVEHATN